MTTQLNPYLSFRGTAREAVNFYAHVLGGTLTLSTFADYGAVVEPEESLQVMHAVVTTPNGFTIMASDTPSHLPFTPGDNFSVSLSGDDEIALREYWTGLSIGSHILEPLQIAPWGDWFGMLVDKFGVRWMINITPVAR